MTLCEVEAFSTDNQTEVVQPDEYGLVHFGDEDENILLGKAASQRTYYDQVLATANHAVDGDTNGDYDGGSCTHTKKKKNPWWKVDIGSVYFTQTVKVFNRVDCCSDRLSDYTIYIGNN